MCVSPFNNSLLTYWQYPCFRQCKSKSMLDKFYYWIGFAVLWLSVIYGVFTVVWWLLTTLLDELGKKFKVLWIMVEFAHYRTRFKEWIKDKDRIKKAI